MEGLLAAKRQRFRFSNMHKTIIRRFIWFTNLAFCCVIGLPALWLFEPFLRIRIVNLEDRRIGHLALDTEAFCRRIQLYPPEKKTLYVFLASNPSNRQLLDMLKRSLFVIESVWIRRLFVDCLPILARTRFHHSIFHDFETGYEAYSRGQPILSFTDEEEARGRELLTEMGIGENDWFVALHVRDSAYLDADKKEAQATLSNGKHHRDADVSTYFDACRLIVEKGGYVLRLGAIVESPLPDLGPKIIDYSRHFRSDFMDIYLLKACRFMLGSDSGYSSMPLLFNVPVAQANFGEFCYAGFADRHLYTPKLYRSTKDGRILTFPELKDLGLFTNGQANVYFLRQKLDDLGLELFDNSAEEVLDLCQDMFDRFEGRSPSAEAVRLQEKFRSYFGDADAASPYAAHIGPRFALKYRHLIEP